MPRLLMLDLLDIESAQQFADRQQPVNLDIDDGIVGVEVHR